MSESKSFWSTLPKIIGGIVGVVTTIATLVGALDILGVIDVINPDTPAEVQTVPADTPLPAATEVTRPTPTLEVTATEPVLDEPAIVEAITVFSEEMRYLLETNDTSRIASVALRDALQDRLDAAALQEVNGCRWRYTETSRDVVQNVRIGPTSSTRATVEADLYVDGTVFCNDVEQMQNRFEGPTTVIFTVAFSDGQWWVIDREVK